MLVCRWTSIGFAERTEEEASGTARQGRPRRRARQARAGRWRSSPGYRQIARPDRCSSRAGVATVRRAFLTGDLSRSFMSLIQQSVPGSPGDRNVPRTAPKAASGRQQLLNQRAGLERACVAGKHEVMIVMFSMATLISRSNEWAARSSTTIGRCDRRCSTRGCAIRTPPWPLKSRTWGEFEQ